MNLPFVRLRSLTIRYKLIRFICLFILLIVANIIVTVLWVCNFWFYIFPLAFIYIHLYVAVLNPPYFESLMNIFFLGFYFIFFLFNRVHICVCMSGFAIRRRKEEKKILLFCYIFTEIVDMLLWHMVTCLFRSSDK